MYQVTTFQIPFLEKCRCFTIGKKKIIFSNVTVKYNLLSPKRANPLQIVSIIIMVIEKKINMKKKLVTHDS